MSKPESIAGLLESQIPAALFRLIKEASAVAESERRPAVLVGGVVRDVLLRRPIFDADIMLEPPARPVVNELAKRLQAEVVSHERFHTFTLHLPNKTKLDIVTAREETYEAPGKLPDVVPSTIAKDPTRRDFTINAMMSWITPDRFGELFDPLRGKADLDAKVIRALHANSFIDDPTRIFRAARFAARLDFEVELETLGWIQDSIQRGLPQKLTPVRRRHEFELVLKEENPVKALKLLKHWNLLGAIHPAWEDGDPSRAVDEAGRFPADAPRLERRLAAWLSQWSALQAKTTMIELGFERETKKRIAELLER